MVAAAIGARIGVIPPRLRCDASVLGPGAVAWVPSGDPENRRTRKAVELLRAKQVRAIVLSGHGFGGDSAWVLARFATELGARPEDLVVEPSATSTSENVALSVPLFEALGASFVVAIPSAPNARRVGLLLERGTRGSDPIRSLRSPRALEPRVCVEPVFGRLSAGVRGLEAVKLVGSVATGELGLAALFE